MPRRKSPSQRAAATTPNPSATNSRYKEIGSGVVLPKKAAGVAKASRPGSSIAKGGSITNDYANFATTSIQEIRDRTDVNDAIRALLREEGIFSNAGNSMVSIAANSGYKLAGYDSSGAMSLEVMAMAWSLIDRIDMHADYTQGYNDKPNFEGLINILQKDVVSSGGCGVEMVLADDYTPERLVPIGYNSVTWQSDGNGGRYPTQDNGDIVLNLPNVFIAEHSRHADEAYSQSPLRPGLNNTIYFNEFLEDTRRSLNRVGHSRMVASIITEKLVAAAPEEIRRDPDALQKWMADQYSAVEGALEGLEPEDALVSFDSIEFKVHDTGGSKADYSTMMSTLGNMQGASLKTPASVTGLRASGGQGLSNAETLVYLQNVDALRTAVEEVLSRALTLAVRLLGTEGSIRIKFDSINLRPEEELEAYRATFQTRILERLSLGLISDAQACYELKVRPQDMVTSLQGTGFASNTAALGTDEEEEGETDEEGDRTTSSGAAASPDTPSKSGGADQ